MQDVFIIPSAKTYTIIISLLTAIIYYMFFTSMRERPFHYERNGLSLIATRRIAHRDTTKR